MKFKQENRFSTIKKMNTDVVINKEMLMQAPSHTENSDRYDIPTQLSEADYRLNKHLFFEPTHGQVWWFYTKRFAGRWRSGQAGKKEKIHVQTNLLRMRQQIQYFTDKEMIQNLYLYRFSSHMRRKTRVMSTKEQQDILRSIELLLVFSEQWPEMITKKSQMARHIQTLADLETYIDKHRHVWVESYSTKLQRLVSKAQVFHHFKLMRQALEHSHSSVRDVSEHHKFTMSFIHEQIEMVKESQQSQWSVDALDRLRLCQYLDRINQLLCHNQSRYVSQFLTNKTLVLDKCEKQEIKSLLSSISSHSVLLTDSQAKEIDQLLQAYQVDYYSGKQKIKEYLQEILASAE